MRYPGQQLTMAPSPSSGGQLEAGKATPSEIAERFRVSPSFMAKLWQRWRCSGRCAALPHAGGTSRHLKDHLETRRPEVAQQPDATLEEVRDRVVSAHRATGQPRPHLSGITAAPTAAHKKSLHASERATDHV